MSAAQQACFAGRKHNWLTYSSSCSAALAGKAIMRHLDVSGFTALSVPWYAFKVVHVMFKQVQQFTNEYCASS